MRLAIIPARGGSKRIPRKNIRAFCGQPIIAWSIAAARESGLFDHLIVSTDDPEIAAVARAHGAHTPFMRPAELADDHAATVPVVRHAIRWALGEGMRLESVCCLYATAPFVRAADLVAGLAQLHEQRVDFVFAATSFGFPVQRALVVDREGLVAPLFPQWIGMRSQDLPETLHDAGQFYWGLPEAFLAHDQMFLARSLALRLPRHRVQDIDTEEDWARAEYLFRALQAQADGP